MVGRKEGPKRADIDLATHVPSGATQYMFSSRAGRPYPGHTFPHQGYSGRPNPRTHGEPPESLWCVCARVWRGGGGRLPCRSHGRNPELNMAGIAGVTVRTIGLSPLSLSFLAMVAGPRVSVAHTCKGQEEVGGSGPWPGSFVASHGGRYQGVFCGHVFAEQFD